MKLEIPSLEDCVKQIKEENSYEIYAERLVKIGVKARKNTDIEFNPIKEALILANMLQNYIKCELCGILFCKARPALDRCYICDKAICEKCIVYRNKPVGYDSCFCKECIHPKFKEG